MLNGSARCLARRPRFASSSNVACSSPWVAVSRWMSRSIAGHFGWTTSGLVDYVTCGEAAGAGRPQPHMLHHALQAAGLLPPGSPVDQVLPDFAYDQVLKVGDTVQDVAEGRNVGALTIAVASGTHSTRTLAEAGPAAVLPSVAELPHWLVTHGYVAHQPAA